MSTYLPRLAALVFDQPHCITPMAAEAVLAALGDRVGLNSYVGKQAVDPNTKQSKGYRITPGGTAIVPIIGELVNRGSWLGASSGLVSYEGLRQTLKLAGEDSKVRRILLDVDSPGGQAAGMFETARAVRTVNEKKPVYAVANSMMASAAYGIASGAAHIFAAEGSMIGSVGVIYVHADYSKWLDNKGLKYSIIHAGAHKADGNPFEPLPDKVRAAVQTRIDRLMDDFVKLVAAGRPKLSEKKIRALEAQVFMAADAVKNGLADKVVSFDDALKEIERNPITYRVPAAYRPKETGMTINTESAGGWDDMTLAELNEAVTALRGSLDDMGANVAATAAAQVPVSAPQAAAPAPAAEPVPAETADAAYARGMKDATARMGTILGHDEAKERQAQAHVIALESDLTVHAATAMLAKMPKEAKADKAGSFYDAVAKSGGAPRVRHADGETGAGDETAALAARMQKKYPDNRARRAN